MIGGLSTWADGRVVAVRFTNKINRTLAAKNMTQAALAEAVESSTVHISRLAQGKCEPRLTLALRIAEVLQIDVRELWGRM